jgi:Domain of unknown function (DUF5071)
MEKTEGEGTGEEGEMKEKADLEGPHFIYPALPIEDLAPELRAALPREKADEARLERIRALGYPAIDPILPHLMTWLQDMNWPIAGRVATLLIPIGRPLLPHIHRVLQGDDDLWKYWVLGYLVKHLESDVIAELRDDLVEISRHVDPEEAYALAGEILEHLRESS